MIDGGTIDRASVALPLTEDELRKRFPALFSARGSNAYDDDFRRVRGRVQRALAGMLRMLRGIGASDAVLAVTEERIELAIRALEHGVGEGALRWQTTDRPAAESDAPLARLERKAHVQCVNAESALAQLELAAHQLDRFQRFATALEAQEVEARVLESKIHELDTHAREQEARCGADVTEGVSPEEIERRVAAVASTRARSARKRAALVSVREHQLRALDSFACGERDAGLAAADGGGATAAGSLVAALRTNIETPRELVYRLHSAEVEQGIKRGRRRRSFLRRLAAGGAPFVGVLAVAGAILTTLFRLQRGGPPPARDGTATAGEHGAAGPSSFAVRPGDLQQVLDGVETIAVFEATGPGRIRAQLTADAVQAIVHAFGSDARTTFALGNIAPPTPPNGSREKDFDRAELCGQADALLIAVVRLLPATPGGLQSITDYAVVRGESANRLREACRDAHFPR